VHLAIKETDAMQRTRMVALILLAFFVTAGVASAKSVKMSGSAQADPNSQISLKVKVSKDGAPKKLKSIKVSHVDTFVYDSSGNLGEPCEGEVGGKFKKFNFDRGPAPSVYSWSGTIDVNGATYQTRGAMPFMNPKSATGNVSFVAGSTICQSRDFKLTSGGGGPKPHGPKPHAL
jgi:hypothetical protein